MLWPWKTSSASTHQHEICVTDWHMHWVVFISCWLVSYGLLLQFVSARGQHAQAETSVFQKHTCGKAHLHLPVCESPFVALLHATRKAGPWVHLREVYAKCNAGQWEFPCSRACRMYSKVETLFLPLPSDKRWLQCPLQLSNLIIPAVQLLLSLNCSNVPSHSKANRTELNDFHPLSFVALSRDLHSQ